MVAIVLLTWINLRGVRESGTVFALPTYAFVVGVLVVIGIGLVRYFGLFGAAPLAATPRLRSNRWRICTGFAYIWLILRAFAAGCTALTGIEAISDGVQAFKPPESSNAATTMVCDGRDRDVALPGHLLPGDPSCHRAQRMSTASSRR